MILKVKLIITIIIFAFTCNAQPTLLEYLKTTRDNKTSVGTQSVTDIKPGAGVFRVTDSGGKFSDFTHYQYGTTIRTNNNIFEFFIGDEPTDIGTLSIRRNAAGASANGAKLDVRDRADVGGITVNSGLLHNGVGEIYQDMPGVTAPVFKISNHNADGKMEFIINNASPKKIIELNPSGDISVYKSIKLTNSEIASNLPNGSIFKGTDGGLYYKGGSGTVTLIAAP